MSKLALPVSFEYLCYGSMAIIDSLIISVRGQSLCDRTDARILTHKDGPHTERVNILPSNHTLNLLYWRWKMHYFHITSNYFYSNAVFVLSGDVSCLDSCVGKENGDYASCKGCNYFETCSNGIMYTTKCQSGLEFHQGRDKCVWAPSSTCCKYHSQH